MRSAVAPERWRQIHPVAGIGVEPAEGRHRRQQILELREPRDVSGFAQRAVRPVKEARDAMTTLPERGLVPAHPRVEILVPEGAAVVGHEHEERVVRQRLFVQEGAQPPYLGIEVTDHREEPHDARPKVGC